MGILCGYMQILNTNIRNKLQLFKIKLVYYDEGRRIPIPEPYMLVINST